MIPPLRETRALQGEITTEKAQTVQINKVQNVAVPCIKQNLSLLTSKSASLRDRSIEKSPKGNFCVFLGMFKETWNQVLKIVCFWDKKREDEIKFAGFDCKWSYEVKGGAVEWRSSLSNEDEILEANARQFPVLQPEFSDFQRTINYIREIPGAYPFLQKMGFSLELSEDQAIFITPSKELLEKNIASYRRQNSDFPELSFVEVEEILSPEEFFELVLNHDGICTKPPEILHDAYYHLIPLFVNLFQNPQNYRPYKDSLKNICLSLKEQLDLAKYSPQEMVDSLIKIDTNLKLPLEDCIKIVPILLWSISAVIDNLTSESALEFKTGKDLANDILVRHYSVLVSHNWQKAASNDLQMDLEEIEILLDPSSPRVYRLLESLYRKAGLI